jgi:hypothetical protein
MKRVELLFWAALRYLCERLILRVFVQASNEDYGMDGIVEWCQAKRRIVRRGLIIGKKSWALVKIEPHT